MIPFPTGKVYFPFNKSVTPIPVNLPPTGFAFNAIVLVLTHKKLLRFNIAMGGEVYTFKLTVACALQIEAEVVTNDKGKSPDILGGKYL